MSLVGLGELFGGFIVSYYVKKYKNNRIGMLINIGLTLASFMFVVAWNEVHEYNALVFISTFLCGVTDCGIQTHIKTLLGFEFDDKSTESFSVFFIFKPIFVFAFLMIGSTLEV